MCRHTLAHSDAVQVLPYRFVSSSGNALAQLGGEGHARAGCPGGKAAPPCAARWSGETMGPPHASKIWERVLSLN